MEVSGDGTLLDNNEAPVLAYPEPGALEWHKMWYPPRRTTGKLREGTYGLLSRDGEVLTVELETGQTLYYSVEYGYSDLKRDACAGRWLLLVRFTGKGCFPWLVTAFHDKQARLLVTPRGQIRGVQWRQGNHYGGCYEQSAWFDTETAHTETIHRGYGACLRSIRGSVNSLSIGVSGTPAAMGERCLHRMWQRYRVPSVWKLRGEAVQLLQRYAVGGRVLTPGLGEPRQTLWEADIRRAYPRALAAGVPFGTMTYHGAICPPDPTGDRLNTTYGEWRVTLHDWIARSPVGVRNWDLRDSHVSYELPSGEYILGAWGQQIRALRETYGHLVSVEWLRGYSWDSLERSFAAWTDEMDSYRVQCEESGDLLAASIVKRATNSAIGRFGCVDAITVRDVADREEADTLMFLGGADGDDVADMPLVALHTDPNDHAAPVHFLSYIRSQVSLAVWRAQRDEEHRGNRLMMANFDGLYFTQQPETLAADSRWKVTEHPRARIPYHRAIVGESVCKLPGLTGAQRAEVAGG